MIRKYKKQLIVSSIIILLPIFVGLILWSALPDQFATHWGIDGEADGWNSKAFAVFVPPVTMLALHWFCFWVTTLDPNTKKQSKKVFGMIFWICPVMSVASSGMIYALALGTEFNVTSVLFPGIAIVFIGMGNYMPKCKQNYTIGIKVPWALHSEENWNATHRFSGKLWVAGGLALLFLAFLPEEMAIAPMFLIIMVMAIIPVLYSWLYYKKQCKAGNAYDTKSAPMDKTTRMIMKGTFIFIAILLIFVAIMLFTGNLEYAYESDCFTIDASYWNDLTVDYADITDIELRDGNISGSRTWGFGSWRLLMGTFENEEFGIHTRYTYYRPEACIVVTCGEKVLVLSGKDASDTKAIYAELTARTEG